MRKAARMSPTSPSSRLPAAKMPNKHRRKVSITDVTSANARTSAITGVGCAAQQQPHQRMLENPRAARQRVGCASHNANIDIAAATHVSAFRTHVWRQKPAAQWCTAKGLVAELKVRAAGSITYQRIFICARSPRSDTCALQDLGTAESARIKCGFQTLPSKRHLRMQDLSTAESARIKCDFQTSPSKQHLRVQDLSTAAAPARAGYAHRGAKAMRQNHRQQKQCNVPCGAKPPLYQS